MIHKLTAKQITVNNETLPFYYRDYSRGDRGALHQIFQDQDYAIDTFKQHAWLDRYYSQLSSTPLIIDAGANIGASAVYFAKTYSRARIFALEPQMDNYHLLLKNTAGLDVVAYRGAIAASDGQVAVTDPGRSDWGYMCVPVSDDTGNLQQVPCLGPASILALPQLADTSPFILKIDIEGGEDQLFAGDTSWIDQFPLVIVELHDWMLPFSGSSRNFLNTVVKYDFDFVTKGENVFLFNRRLLN
jgi:FkbM family methyltransferase